MSEEETTKPADNIGPAETTAQSDVTPQFQPSSPTFSPAKRNVLHIAIIIVALIPLNFFLYHSFKTSQQSGDNGNASSSDGIANMLNTAKQMPSYDTYLGLGVAYYNTHRFQEAIDAWQKGLQFNPNSDVLYSNIGAAYNCLGKWQEGKDNCEKALAINPGFALAKNNLNWAVSELAKTTTAANTGNNNAAATGPSPTVPAADFNALLDEGLGYYNQKKFEQAIAVWQKALQLNPNSEVVYSNIGAAYGCLHMWREQVAACEKALAINPNYQLAANNLAWGKSELAKRGIKP